MENNFRLVEASAIAGPAFVVEDVPYPSSVNNTLRKDAFRIQKPSEWIDIFGIH